MGKKGKNHRRIQLMIEREEKKKGVYKRCRISGKKSGQFLTASRGKAEYHFSPNSSSNKSVKRLKRKGNK